MKSSILSHIKAVFLLPFTGVVVIPAVILYLTSDVSGVWDWEYPTIVPRIVGGSILIVLGLYLLTWTIRLFAAFGRGTLTPWEPPKKLVVLGIYRHLRNPMIGGVLVILLGEAVLFGSGAVLVLCVLFFIGNNIYFRFFEEPALVKRFGDEYIEYRQNVPGWLPRLKPWTKTDIRDSEMVE